MKIIASPTFSGLFDQYCYKRIITRLIKPEGGGLWFLFVSNEFIDNRKYRDKRD